MTIKARPHEHAVRNALADENAIQWRNLLFVLFSLLACLVLAPLYISTYGLEVGDLLCLAVMIGLTGLAITAGYHRHYAHRSYHCARAVQVLYLTFGAAALQAPVIDWVAKHRDHHRFVDQDGDPYSIKRGFFWAHVGWMFRWGRSSAEATNVTDLTRDSWVQFFNRYHLLVGTAVGVGLPFLLGLCFGRPFGGVLWGGLVRVVVAHHSTFLVNSAAHCFGRQPYSTRNSARDSRLVALLTLGEGYHNFHHAFPRDFRNGVRWYHWDPTKWWIMVLSAVGLARGLHATPAAYIAQVRLREAALVQQEPTHDVPREAHRARAESDAGPA